MNRFFLGAYWFRRKESMDSCGNRLLRFLGDLKSSDPALSRWFMLGLSRAKALEHEVDLRDRAAILKLLEGGRHWTDFDKQPVPELGFSIGLWNGERAKKAARLTLTCGAYANHMRTPNRVIIDLPHALGGLACVSGILAVIAATVNAWQPAWAGVMSYDAIEKRSFRTDQPFVDWVVHLSHELLPIAPDVPPPASINSGVSGTTIVVQPEPTDPLNDIHVQNAFRVDRALRSKWLPAG